jgi:hypothetical protein
MRACLLEVLHSCLLLERLVLVIQYVRDVIVREMKSLSTRSPF